MPENLGGVVGVLSLVLETWCMNVPLSLEQARTVPFRFVPTVYIGVLDWAGAREASSTTTLGHVALYA
jgi:hypothetical protein